MTEGDLPRVHAWLAEPHVAEFWSAEPGELEALLRDDEPAHAFIASADAMPIAYLQTYRIDDHPDYAAHVAVGADAAGVDMFIGEPAFAHRGLGAPLLAQFVADIVWSVTRARTCWIDPAADNARAIRAYVKAGFEYVKTVHIPGEDQPEYLMRLIRGER